MEEAKKNIDVQEQNFEELIADLETSRATIEKEQEELSAYKAQVESLKKRLEDNT